MITGGGGSGVLVSGATGSGTGDVELGDGTGISVVATVVTGTLGATATGSVGPQPTSIAVPRTVIANLATITAHQSEVGAPRRRQGLGFGRAAGRRGAHSV